MKKIGILTHYYHNKNIGGLLQSFALVQFLNKNKFLTYQLAFDFKFFDKNAYQILLYLRWKQIPAKILLKFFIFFNHLLTFQQLKNISSQLHMQNQFFVNFEKQIPHSSQVYNNTNIVHANEKYDLFITGSDQVFASYLFPFNAYYGEFAIPNKKVIAYAASSDRKQFSPKAETLFAKKLQRLNAISVREKTLKEYIERITNKKATVVLDPTFLLSPQEWLKISNPNPIPKKPYIFCYFLGDKSIWQRKIARMYADRYGYEVIHLPYIMQSIRPADRFLKGQGRYDVGPREFIALINGAQCVFTDSFHGLAFSINFGKNFYVFNRDDKSGPDSMNARITDTLATFGLTARHITDKNAVLDNTPLDFRNAHEILAREKEFSINWLLNALKD